MTQRVKSNKTLQNLFYRLARSVALFFFSRRFALTADPEPDFPGPYMVIANHVTELDFILVAKVFKTPLSFVVGHGLMQNRLLAFVLLRLAGVITKQKSTTDARTTLGILRGCNPRKRLLPKATPPSADRPARSTRRPAACCAACARGW